ncbi:MAG: NAD-glutamate dehydrogenase [Actinomycetota bacterium]
MTTIDPWSALADDTLLKGLLERIAERLPPDRAEALSLFATLYLRRLPDEEFSRAPVEEVYAHVLGLFDFVDERGNEPVAVRAFTPDLERDGYATVGSVIEISTEDAPFLVDSVTEEIVAHGLGVHRLIHPVIGTDRGPDGRIRRVLHAREAPTRESAIHVEVDRRPSSGDLEDLRVAILRVLRDVRLAVRDFVAMQERVRAMAEIARAGSPLYDEEEIADTIAFLEWLLDLNFVFLGYREYDLLDTAKGKALAVRPDTGLGILSDPERSGYSAPVPLAKIDPDLRARIEGGEQLVISKTNATSTVHRRAKMDYIGVRRVGPDGTLLGEARLIGLFTSKAYMESASDTPLLNRKLLRILEAEDIFEGSHDHKTVVQLFESFPKDELFSASWEQIRDNVMGLLALQERESVRLFVRRDLVDRSVSLLVALPRDAFNAELRHKLQDLFMERFHGSSIDYHLALGEADPAQIHFRVWVEGNVPDVSFSQLEGEVAELARGFEDKLRDVLAERVGDERGRLLAERWVPRFPEYYTSSVEPFLAAADVEMLDRLDNSDRSFVIGLQSETGTHEDLTRLALYRKDGKLQLSEILPVLEALGLRVVEEVPTRLVGDRSGTFVHDFGVLGSDGAPLDLEACGSRVASAITAILEGEAESDWLNRLVIAADLEISQVGVLRAYRTFQLRVGWSFTPSFVNDTLVRYPHMARKLVRLFEARFDPDRPAGDDEAEQTASELRADLDQVTSLDEDRILRGTLGAILATTRTNAYRSDRQSLALKLRSAEVPEMPKPHPLYEIFVWASGVEAIHLRGGMVARGGIRWSDRTQDYRTEVLGLMKAQMTKNAVIVPTGSKGGFVLRRPPSDPAELREDVKRQYTVFMRGLLDVTDNRIDGEIVRPHRVRAHDGDDPYLVVAADKGTAALSDTANAIAQEYRYWLGDAFASGGSAGYDHKELGITARGAWESVKRHFREIGVDVQADPFSVVGIGDMSGDVFGNGMLLSEQIRLVAAFDHRHIFVDPSPDAAPSFKERHRLFELGTGTSWEDYDASLISAGGGVWPRTSKSIPISAQMREALGIEAEAMTPPELIHAILLAPADLLWNGGIGTYVKSRDESHDDVGDRANDAIRVDGRQLRARVVAEGGNLGATQLGRIEYALAGGRINTDFIDNSAGVDSSDHEVNLKILLGLAISRGELTVEGRDELVEQVAGDVVAHVLYDNFLQAQILSQEVERSAQRLEAYEDLMSLLDSNGMLDRQIEFLPSSEEMAERSRQGTGMVRPELAVLLAYAKRLLYSSLLESDLPDSPYLEGDVRGYFPPKVIERFGHLVPEHPLRRELVATIIANDIVNSQGITFTQRLMLETGAQVSQVSRAYRIARDVTDAVERWEDVEELSGHLDPDLLNELMEGIDWLVETTSRWYLARSSGKRLAEAVGEQHESFRRLSDVIAEAGPPAWREAREAEVQRLMARGAPEDVARRHAFQAELAHGPDIIELGRITGRPLEEIARLFFVLGDVLHIDWLESQLERIEGASRWERWAVQATEDDLLLARRRLAEYVLHEGGEGPPEQVVRRFIEAHDDAWDRLQRFFGSLRGETTLDLSMATVAVRQLRGLIPD